MNDTENAFLETVLMLLPMEEIRRFRRECLINCKKETLVSGEPFQILGVSIRFEMTFDGRLEREKL